MSIRIRLYDDEAKNLGLSLNKKREGRKNAEYKISEELFEKVKHYRKYKIIKRLFYDIETSQ